MQPFEHANPTTVEKAVRLLSDDWSARLVAGGTDLLGEMKEGIIAPARLVNLKSVVGLHGIDETEGGELHVGPLTRLCTIEESLLVQRRAPILGQAAAAAASPQLRNMGTIAGNLCQRPRCWYYRGDFPCLRKGGQRCFSVRGDNRFHAILGGGPCFIVHPSDTAPALIALDAALHIVGPHGDRRLKLQDFFVGPRVDPHRENLLGPREIITNIEIPPPPEGSRGLYLKMRERQSWSFALVSVAAQLAFDRTQCTAARIVLGGVAPIPWRAQEAEQILIGHDINATVIDEAAKAALDGARPMKDNAYKVTMAQNLVARVITQLAATS